MEFRVIWVFDSKTSNRFNVILIIGDLNGKFILVYVLIFKVNAKTLNLFRENTLKLFSLIIEKFSVQLIVNFILFLFSCFH